MPFQPGQSGNPSGRPQSHLKYLEAKYGKGGIVLLDQIMALAKAMRRKQPKVTANCLQYLHDKGWGKAAQSLTVSAPVVPLFALPPGIQPSLTDGTLEAEFTARTEETTDDPVHAALP